MGRFKRISVLMLSVIVIILFVGCNDLTAKDLPADPNSQTENRKDNEENRPIQGIEYLEPVLTLDGALTVFSDTFEKDSINLYEIEFKTDSQGDYHYFIEGWDSYYTYKLELDAETADIIKKEKKDNKKRNGILDLDTAITPKEAMDAVVEETADEGVKNWRIILENNQMIYKIGLASGKSQKVDAVSSKLLK